jgi:hypothetical protein
MNCAKSGQNWSNGSGEEVENITVYGQTDRWMLNNRQSINVLELSVQVR